MKFIAFVDLHGNHRHYHNLKKLIRKEKPDFLVCAGDFTTFEHELKFLMHRLSRFDGRVFLVHGNHEEETVVRSIASHYKNLEFVHARIAEFGNLVILGWGGGGFTIRDVEFEQWARTIRKRLKKYKKEGKKILLITHGPPYNAHVDFLYDSHCGNKSFSNFIRHFKVDVAVCGHLHETEGKQGRIGNCSIYNPGPKGKVIEI
jgi:Icc-related predicted phosphoesterase